MRLFVAIKIERTPECKHVELHKFWLPDVRDQGFYRSVGTFNAFAHNGDQKRSRGNWSPTHLYAVKMWEEFVHETEGRIAFSRKHGFKAHDDRTLPTFEHATIWDFYLHQGYDYKKKKWNSQPVTKGVPHGRRRGLQNLQE